MSKNYYEILGITQAATNDEIKKAYKKAAVKWHPDKWSKKSDGEKKHAEEMFKDVNEAYACLSDKQKRAHYDRFGSMEGFGGFNGFSGFNKHEFDFSDIFDNDFFGFNNNQSRKKTQADSIQLNMGISIEELFNGVHRTVEYNNIRRCKSCNGEGGKGIKTCPHCNGTGMVTETRRTAFGVIQNTHPCNHCHGTGKTFDDVCEKCHGTGIENFRDSIEINVNGPIYPEQIIEFTGKGTEDKDKSIANGDLIIRFMPSVDSAKYNINGYDIYEYLDVNIFDCLLGCKKQVKHPSGITYEINIPECCKAGRNIPLSGKGILNRGSYIYVVNPIMPNKLSDEQRELLKKINK